MAPHWLDELPYALATVALYVLLAGAVVGVAWLVLGWLERWGIGG